MNSRKNFYRIFLMIGFIVFMFKGTTSYASEFNFAVHPVIPTNQVDKNKTYFDLKMDPGQKQTVDVQLKNDTDKEIIVEATIDSATTNLNGVVEYGQNQIKPDDSLKYNIADYAKITKDIKIPAKDVIKVPVELTMPTDKYDGVMAGGITFKEKKTDDSPQSKDKGLAIKNEYSYVIALLMRQNENTVEPDLKLLNASAGQVNARNVINVQLQNPVARYINQLKLTGEIIKKGDDKVKYIIDAESLQMAPNSSFNYPVSLDGKRLEPGDYQLKLTAYGNKSADGKNKVANAKGEELKFLNKWDFEKEFSISGEVAKKYNEKDVSIEETNHTPIYWIIGLLLLIIALLLLFLLWKKKKKKEQEMAKKKSKKKKSKKKKKNKVEKK
ncbi:cell surface protein [Vagococcus penaei]|uniref:Cell surface protein n=1 Tax=Vagococcus penaei TaxID=633807 RepID=A0A1Q2D4T7_9ENTE|nr:DUF916 and DUF3324 domain-containing protein [Vagococcus penaei]AQP53422.1 cell surface protein [Vagococcus penaei]RST97647.1 cell surface protein [Vagococcus penaei]